MWRGSESSLAGLKFHIYLVKCLKNYQQVRYCVSFIYGQKTLKALNLRSQSVVSKTRNLSYFKFRVCKQNRNWKIDLKIKCGILLGLVWGVETLVVPFLQQHFTIVI